MQEEVKEVNEGLAKIKLKEGIFYNPRMKRLRDLSVLMLKSLEMRGYRALDATAATGVRGIRYALEAGAKPTFLDINKEAAELTKQNVKGNGIEGEVYNASIHSFSASHPGKFEVIDLDPFGTPAPYLFDLMSLAKDKSVLMVTATDTATLCGAEGNACLRIYGSIAVNGRLCHEAGTRILLAYVARIAAQFNFAIEPLLSIAEMHYIRLFLRLIRGAKSAVEAVKQIGTASSCPTCHSFYYSKGIEGSEKVCRYCKSKTIMFGPLWLGSLYDKQVIASMLQRLDEMQMSENEKRQLSKTLELLANEYDTPFFYDLDGIASYLHIGSVKKEMAIKSLKEKGFEATPTQFDEHGIKTNAGIEEAIGSVESNKYSATKTQNINTR